MPTIQAAPIVMQAAAPMMMQAAPMAMQAITPFSIQAAPMAMQAAPFSIQAAPMAMQAAPFAIQAAPMGMQGIAPFSVQGAAPTMTLSPFAASAPAYSVQATPSFSLQLPFNLQMPQATFGPQGTGRAQGALSPQSTKDQPSEASLGDTLIKISNHLDKLHRIADVHTQVLHAHEYRIRALEEFAGSVGDPKNNLAKEVQDELRALWDNAQKKNKEPAK